MIIRLLHRGDASAGLQLAALQLTAEAALDDATEPVFFQHGAVEAAVRLGSTVSEARQQARYMTLLVLTLC